MLRPRQRSRRGPIRVSLVVALVLSVIMFFIGSAFFVFAVGSKLEPLNGRAREGESNKRTPDHYHFRGMEPLNPRVRTEAKRVPSVTSAAAGQGEQFISLREYPASIDIRRTLRSCKSQSSRSLQFVLKNGVRIHKCRNRYSFESLMCALQCDEEEPELEDAFRFLRTSTYTFDHLIHMCRDGSVSALVLILENTPKFFVCGGRDHVQGRSVFSGTTKLFSMLSCVSDLPNVLFALDNSDWATPPGEGNVRGYVQPLPAIVRYTATPAHPTLLLPTNAYVRATTHCNIASDKMDTSEITSVCRQVDEHQETFTPWNQRKELIFWRGSSTGVPLAPLLAEYLPRPALVQKYFREPGFDVGFIGGQPPSTVESYDQFFASHRKDYVSSHRLCDARFLLHCDGHTASWGLAHKLTTNSVVLWLRSWFHYREFYYTLLLPWHHYIPGDINNLVPLKEWLFSSEGSKVAEQIAANARALFETRLRPEATYCYLSRLIHSLAQVQRHEPTLEMLVEKGLPLHEWLTMPEFRHFINE